MMADLLAGLLPVGTTIVMIGLAIWHGKELLGFFASASSMLRMLTVVALLLVVAMIFGVVEIHLEKAADLVMGPLATAFEALVNIMSSAI